jgi:tetratricopeptide (TPR) repeat protein
MNTISSKAELVDVANSYKQANDFYAKISNNPDNEKYIINEGTTIEGYYFWKCKFDLARVSFKQNKFRDAWVNYIIAAKYYLPDSSYYLAAMAVMKENETVKSQDRGPLNKPVLEFFSKAIILKPGNKLYVGERGKFYLQTIKDTINGLADLNKAAALQSIDPEVYYQLALFSHSKLHNDQEAIRNFTACLNLKPEKADYYYLRALLYRDTKQFKEALQDFKSAIKYGKANPDYYAGRGYCNGQLNNFIEAYDDYNVALLLNPKDDISRNNVQKLDPVLKAEYAKNGVTANNAFQYFMKQGDNYLKNDDKLYAALSFTKCTKIEPTNTEPYNKAGKIYGFYKMNNYAEPFLHFAAYSNGKNARYFVDLGSFYIESLSEFKKASGILDTAALLGSKNELGYYYNGLCKQYALENTKGALNDYTTAIQLKPNFKEALLKRGDLLLKEFNNPKAALADYETLNSLDPLNDVYLSKIKECRDKIKS